MKILLASKSKRRRDLIKQVTDNVSFTESGADETLPKINLTPSESAMFLAEKKALTSLRHHTDRMKDDELIVACDTVVTLGDKIFGKPKDRQEAFETLKELSGKTHSVITAVCILNKSHKHDLFYEVTDVTFNDLTDEMINDYIDTGDPFDKAGSYGIQNVPKSFIKQVQGNYDNVVGLPTKKLKTHLDEFSKFSNFENSPNNATPYINLLKHHMKHIHKANSEKIKEAREYLLTKTMPEWALGDILDLAVDIVGMTGDLHPAPSKKLIFVMAGDHGVADESVSAYPQEVTVQMAENILNGGAAINAFANQAGADVVLVDMGIKNPEKLYDNDLEEEYKVRIRQGTHNIKKQSAMHHSEALKAILSGYNLANKKIREEGYNVIGIGELGIGNTTSAAAITAVVTGKPVQKVTGRGTGLDDTGLRDKIKVIEEAIEVNQPNPEDAVDILSKIGGLEIGGMVGVILSCAVNNVPVIIDGYVASSAALLAYLLKPETLDYMVFSHKSAEPGHDSFYQFFGKKPLLDLNMRLGEGTGSALAMNLVDASKAILNQMATFESAGVSTKNE